MRGRGAAEQADGLTVGGRAPAVARVGEGRSLLCRIAAGKVIGTTDRLHLRRAGSRREALPRTRTHRRRPADQEEIYFNAGDLSISLRMDPNAVRDLEQAQIYSTDDSSRAVP